MNIGQKAHSGKRRKLSGEDIYNRLVDVWDKFGHTKEKTNPTHIVEKRFTSQISRFIRDLKTNSEIMNKALFGEEPEMYLPYHGVNVAALGTKVALGMGYSDNELKRLALASLIHDVGMKEIPAQIWTKKRPLSASEVDAIRRHPLYGYELIKPIEEVANVIVQEHERMDGTGYPHGLSGKDIHEFAYIIGVTDIYNSLTHIRPYRENRYSSFEAIKEIMTKEKGKFPSSVLKPLVAHFLFPVGSRVELDSGEKAEVQEVNRVNPMRPTVKITHDKNNREYNKTKIVDLDRDQRLCITRSLSMSD